MAAPNLSTYCSLPFTGFDDRSRAMCCWAKLEHRYNSFTELITAPEVKSLQKDLAQGIRNPSCNSCWQQEDAGITSMRQHCLEKKSVRDLQQEIAQPTLKHLVIDSGNVCNLACRTCGWWASSAHFNEDEARAVRIHQIVEHREFKNSDLNVLLHENYCDIKTISILGGEPFLNLDHLKLLEKIIQEGHSKNCQLIYSTNATVRLPDKIVSIFHNFKAVGLSLSIDAVGMPFNYIRTLGDWDHVSKNVAELKIIQQQEPNIYIQIHPTISVLNVLYLDELFSWINDQGFIKHLVFCDHSYYGFTMLPPDKKQTIIDQLKSSEFDMTSIINHINSTSFNQTDYDRFWDEIQFTKKFRGLDIEEYLPRLCQLLRSPQ